MGYKATFEIDGAVSHGFGLKSPDNYREEVSLSSENDLDALLESAKKAFKLSRDGLSNPETGMTKVTLLSLVSETDILNPKDILKQKGYDCVNRFYWNEQGRLYTECSMEEHILSL